MNRRLLIAFAITAVILEAMLVLCSVRFSSSAVAIIQMKRIADHRGALADANRGKVDLVLERYDGAVVTVD